MNNYIEIFWFKIYFYGLVYAIWFLIWYLFFLWLGKQEFSFIRKRRNLSELFNRWIDDLFLAIVLWIIIGWRLWHVIIYNLNYYLEKPIEIFYLWNWWMSFVWAVIGVVFGLYWIYKKYKLMFEDLLVLSDLILVVFPFILIFGRITNFLNQELYGRTIDSLWSIWNFFDKIWLVYVYNKVDNNIRINTNFLEAILEGFVIFIINFYLFIKYYIKDKINPWFITWMFLILYGIFRFFIEYLREYNNTEYILFFTKTQLIMLVFMFLGIYLIFSWKRKDNYL